MNRDYRLFLDMDGVLVDYQGGYHKLARSVKKGEIEGEEWENAISDAYVNAGGEFWANLDWLYGGEELWKASKGLFEHVYILSSTGVSSPEWSNIVVGGKLAWLEKHVPEMDPKNIFIVNGKHLKPHFADKMSILVDDVFLTIQRWNNAGGYGILHNFRHYRRTIETLEDISRPVKLKELIKRIRR